MLSLFFRKPHKLDSFPRSSSGYPLRKWGGHWCEFKAGKWVLARFEPSTIIYNKELSEGCK